ncbi:GNAT family N-acetyltransferase [Roseivivax sp. GX 12232]|uniref:GNAT family N-acetyltransferase n=1 Tax=Roseivivax sp. GX 12232 TaxID=2900547 RepID=UPI00351CCF70
MPPVIRPYVPDRDADWLADLHARLYAREAGFDARFGKLVEEILAEFAATHDPRRERGFVAEEVAGRSGAVPGVISSEAQRGISGAVPGEGLGKVAGEARGQIRNAVPSKVPGEARGQIQGEVPGGAPGEAPSDAPGAPRRLGSIFCVAEGHEVARLRLFLLHPEARGQGLGRRLLGVCTEFARAAGYRRMVLSTHESHRAACRLYAATGWRCLSAHPVTRFGQALVEQQWGRAL